MKIAIITLGCKVNQYESEVLLKLLEEMGHEVVDSLEFADTYIINTCAVTNEAERKSRQHVGKCLSINPMAKIVVCGCASQNNQDKFLISDNVIYITGTANKYEIVNILEDNIGVKVYNHPLIYENSFSPKQVRTRVFVKIQDGCNNFCSYCIIPYLRGRSRSRNVQDVVKECEELQEISDEIVLTGIDMSSYGKDIGTNLIELIKSLKNIKSRIRLGSLENTIISQELLDALKDLQKFCPEFHLSLQSGSNAVLKKMNRKYTIEEYRKKVNLIRNNFEDATITTDIICGFPTETEEDFENTKNFVKEISFMQTHIFGYSLRDGTVAAKFKQLPKEVIKKRVLELEQVADEVRKNELSKFIGKEQEVLFENEYNDKYKQGHSRNFIKFYKENAGNGKILKVIGKTLFIDGLLAEE